MYSVSFTGYRPAKLGFTGEGDPRCVKLRQMLSEAIAELVRQGADKFYTGMALGVDTWCALSVMELKKSYPEIGLYAVIPCPNQHERWSDCDKMRYRRIMDSCSDVICVSASYTKDCMLQRNRALVDSCDLLLAVYDGKSGGTKYTVDYANRCGKKVILIEPPSE